MNADAELIEALVEHALPTAGLSETESGMWRAEIELGGSALVHLGVTQAHALRMMKLRLQTEFELHLAALRTGGLDVAALGKGGPR